MRVTIITETGSVGIEGIWVDGIDLSFLESDIHAVQWYGDKGEIERHDDSKINIISNEPITSFAPFESVLALWEAKREADTLIANNAPNVV
jgi:hypothetical protein